MRSAWSVAAFQDLREIDNGRAEVALSRSLVSVAAGTMETGDGWLGMALSDVDELPAAVETLEAAVAVAPRSVNAQVALAVALTRAGETARAIPLLEAAVESEPDNPWAHRNLGTCLLQSGRADEALPHFESVTVLARADAAAHLGLAQAHEALGQGALADCEYRRTLAGLPQMTGTRGAAAADGVLTGRTRGPDASPRNASGDGASFLGQGAGVTPRRGYAARAAGMANSLRDRDVNASRPERDRAARTRRS